MSLSLRDRLYQLEKPPTHPYPHDLLPLIHVTCCHSRHALNLHLPLGALLSLLIQHWAPNLALSLISVWPLIIISR